MCLLDVKNLKVKVSDSWSEPTNLYICQVANKGDGKSPGSRSIFKKLVDLEKEEKRIYDEEQADRISRKKRQRDEGNGQGDGASSEVRAEESRMFHKKTRIVESITIEALYCTLEYGSKNLLLKHDEFKAGYKKV